MAIVSAPSALMTQTAAQLLAAAAELGLPADVVATTGDTPLGLGFQVPDELFDLWTSKPNEPGDEAVISVLQVPADPEPEPKVTVAVEPKTPEPKVPKKRGPGAKPVTDEQEA